MGDNREKILEFLTRQAEGIAVMFGSNCETLVHDMSKPGHPILVIFNGHISGRTVGSIDDIYGNQSQPAMTMSMLAKDFVNTQVITKTGRFIKSSTFHYVGDSYHFALGINFDYTPLTGAYKMITELTSVDAHLEKAIVAESNQQLEDIFNACMAVIGKPVSAMKKNDRLRLITMLQQKNAFSFQKSVAYVAEKLNVSRYTIYKYQHEVEEK